MRQASITFFGFLLLFAHPAFAANSIKFALNVGYFSQNLYYSGALTLPESLGDKWVKVTDNVGGKLVTCSYCRQRNSKKVHLANMYKSRSNGYTSCGWRDRDNTRFGGGFQRRHDFHIPGYSLDKAYLIRAYQKYSIKTPEHNPQSWPAVKINLSLYNKHDMAGCSKGTNRHFYDFGNPEHRYEEIKVELKIPKRVKNFQNQIRLDFFGFNVQDARLLDLMIEIMEFM